VLRSLTTALVSLIAAARIYLIAHSFAHEPIANDDAGEFGEHQPPAVAAAAAIRATTNGARGWLNQTQDSAIQVGGANAGITFSAKTTPNKITNSAEPFKTHRPRFESWPHYPRHFEDGAALQIPRQ
jgi:hypothetical protein